MKIILIVLGIIAMTAIFTNYSPQAEMSIQNLQASVTTLAYVGEIDDIKKAVDDFMVLRTALGTEDEEFLASQLDQRINELGLVKNYCTHEISSLELAYTIDPYEEIQQICPALKNISFGKAIELFRSI